MENQLSFYQQKLEYELDSSDLFTRVNQDEKIIIIDTRSPSAYETERIPGSINLPHREMNTESTKSLDKDILYVTYCDGIGCNGSTKGAYKMTKLGFKVKELMGGLDWWKRDAYETHGKSAQAGSSIKCAC
jgi:rhodanese-related sulfurtransferase